LEADNARPDLISTPLFFSSHRQRNLGVSLEGEKMSGAASSAASSRFASFMNHPAGVYLRFSIFIEDSQAIRHRTENCLLLGPADEMVSCRGRIEGHSEARGEIECESERWYVPSFVGSRGMDNKGDDSTRGDGVHLGTVLFGDHAY
jgi:hypothetical protein